MNIYPASSISLSEFVQFFNDGFEGYFTPVHATEEMISFISAYALLDWSKSLVAEVDGERAGFLLLGARGWTMRGAAMGIVKKYRNKGIGSALMERGVKDSREAGFRKMILEVFEPNAPAIHVYEKTGFKTKRRLLGYECPAENATGETAPVSEIDPYQFALAVVRYGDEDLPWMNSVEYFAPFTPSMGKAYSLEEKAFAFAMPKSNELGRISGIVVNPEYRRQGWGTRLVRGIFSLYPDRKWEMIPVFPEGMLDGFLASLGFRVAELNQLEMEQNL